MGNRQSSFFVTTSVLTTQRFFCLYHFYLYICFNNCIYMAYSKDYVNKAKSILIEEISIGFSVLEIGRRHKKDIPSRDTIYKWHREDVVFADNYARAKQDSADVDADKVKEIADGALKGTYDASAARVAIDAYKWAAGKKKPKVYGDRVDVTSGGEKLSFSSFLMKSNPVDGDSD